MWKSINIIKKPKLILVLILAAFFLKGAILATAFPIFTGQDESRHYNTVQYHTHLEENLAAEKTKALTKKEKNEDDLETYNFSQEIQKSANSAGVNLLREELFNTSTFVSGYRGQNENQIENSNWSPLNTSEYPDIAMGSKIYYPFASLIEKTLSDQNILVRFFANRIFSVFLGTFTIFLFYLIFKKSGFSEKHSLLLTAIASFQPKFSMYFANINYDVLLIPAFALFTFAAVWSLKDNLNWKNGFLLIFATAWAMLAKGTGNILLVVLALLIAYFGYQKIQMQKRNFRYAFYGCSTGIFLVLIFYLQGFLSIGDRPLGKILALIVKYLQDSLTIGRLALTGRTYWGTLSWVNSWFIDNALNLIWLVEFLAAIGLVLYFFYKRRSTILPQKEFVIFFLIISAALQLGIRTYDWAVYISTGNFDLGTPGRYFLPNLGSHLALIFVGLGALLGKEKYLDNALKSLLLGMFAFSTYLIFNIVILRFYL